MPPDLAVLFDLDGTLLDTLGDIASAANAALVLEGFPAHPTIDYKRFVGDGVAMLFRRALPGDLAPADDLIARCVGRFGKTYESSWNVQTRPFDGVPELLDALVGRSVRMGVLSNKPDDFTRRYGASYLGAWPIDPVVGQREGVPRKPDPASALEIARGWDLPTDRVVYVGDSGVDMKTARAAGMLAVGVSWGFRPVDELKAEGADHVIDRPGELLPIVDRMLGAR